MMKTYEEIYKESADNKALSDKFYEMFLLMNRWTMNLQQGKKISSYFERMNYKKIAIYGTSYVSKSLQRELENTDVEIALIFDKTSIEDIRNCDVDVIVVTSMYYFYDIIIDLEKLTDDGIESIWEIVWKI